MITAVGFFERPEVVTAIGVVIAASLSFLGYHLSSKSSTKVTEKLGVQSGSAQSIAQAFEGLVALNTAKDTFIAVLQADNRVTEEDLSRCKELVNQLQKELNRMYRLYGSPVNGE